MKLLRGASAILACVVGVVALALGLYSLAAMWGVAAQMQQPIDSVALAVGLVACAVGFLFLFASRAIDPENGPIRSYRKRPRKVRTQA